MTTCVMTNRLMTNRLMTIPDAGPSPQLPSTGGRKGPPRC